MLIIWRGGFILSDINFESVALFEHRFWLQILGDHGRFIYNTLSPSEINKIQKAEYFIDLFDVLLDQARKPLSGDEIQRLTQSAHQHAKDIRVFKLEILEEHLVGEIVIGLGPTFINHMVNEVEEYLRILNFLLNNEIPTDHPLHYHDLWLPDAVGHAGAIQCGLDEVEKDLREKSKEFAVEFNDLYNKADEFSGYLRTCLRDFPALHRLNNQVELKILLFMRFLEEIKELRISKQAVGTLMPLMPDHMFREECYYLTKLSRVSQINMPDCDATKPRI